MPEGNENADFDPVEEGTVNDDVSPEDVLGEEAFQDEVPDEADGDAEGSVAELEDGHSPEETPIASEEPQIVDPVQQAVESTEERPPAEHPSPGTPAQVPQEEPLVPVQFERAGQVVELHVTQAEADVLGAIKTSAEQFPHVQKLLLEERQRSGQKVPGQQQQGPQAPPNEYNHEAFLQAMEPRLESAVETGTISRDFRELYPDEAATAVYMFDEMNQIRQVINQAQQEHTQIQVQSEREAFKRRLYDEMIELANEDQVMGDLGKPETRDAYFQFLYDFDVAMSNLTPQKSKSTLRTLFNSFKGEELRAGAQAANQRAAAENASNRRNAVGGGGGARTPQSKRGPRHPDIAEVLSMD